jgi:hypothetical protein
VERLNAPYRILKPHQHNRSASWNKSHVPTDLTLLSACLKTTNHLSSRRRRCLLPPQWRDPCILAFAVALAPAVVCFTELAGGFCPGLLLLPFFLSFPPGICCLIEPPNARRPKPCQAPRAPESLQNHHQHWRLNFQKLGIVTPPNPLN